MWLCTMSGRYTPQRWKKSSRDNCEFAPAYTTLPGFVMRRALNDRFSELLNDEEGTSKEAFMSTCLHNPSLRDRFPILVHSFQNKKKASHFLKFTFLTRDIMSF